MTTEELVKSTRTKHARLIVPVKREKLSFEEWLSKAEQAFKQLDTKTTLTATLVGEFFERVAVVGCQTPSEVDRFADAMDTWMIARTLRSKENAPRVQRPPARRPGRRPGG